jgi:hypothetical protein
VSQLIRAFAGTNNNVPLFNGTGSFKASGINDDGTTVTALNRVLAVQTTGADSDAQLKIRNDVQIWRIEARGSAGAPDSLIVRDESAGVDLLTLTKGAAGSLTVTNSLTVNGNSTLGDAATDTHTVNGTTDFVMTNLTGFVRFKPATNTLGHLSTLYISGVRTDITGIFEAVQIRPVMGASYTSGITFDTYNSAGSAINTNLLFIDAVTRKATFPADVDIGDDLVVTDTLTVNGNCNFGDATSDQHNFLGTTLIEVNNNAACIVLGKSTKDWTFYPSGDDLRLFEYTSTFGTGGNDRVTFEAGGNVGIGNTNPAFTLDITGTLNTTGNATLGDADGDAHVFKGTAKVQTTGADSNAIFGLQNDARTWQFICYGSGSDVLRIYDATGGNAAITVLPSTGAHEVTLYGGLTVGDATAAALIARGNLQVDGNTRLGNAAADLIGFYTTAGVAQQTVTGSRASGAALTDLLTKLANTGIIVDGTSA